MISLLSANHPYEYDSALKVIIEHTTSFEILQKALLLIRSSDLKADLVCKKIRERLELVLSVWHVNAVNISDADNYPSIKSQDLLDEVILLAQLIPDTHIALKNNLLHDIALFAIKIEKIEIARNIADSMTMEYWKNSVNSALEEASKSKTAVNMDVPPQVTVNEAIQDPVEFGRNFKQLLSTNQLDEALNSALSLKDPERRNVFLKDLVEIYVKNKDLQMADQIVKMMTAGILKNQALKFIKDAKSSCSVM
jgi:hypothetical protein